MEAGALLSKLRIVEDVQRVERAGRARAALECRPTLGSPSERSRNSVI